MVEKQAHDCEEQKEKKESTRCFADREADNEGVNQTTHSRFQDDFFTGVARPPGLVTPPRLTSGRLHHGRSQATRPGDATTLDWTTPLQDSELAVSQPGDALCKLTRPDHHLIWRNTRTTFNGDAPTGTTACGTTTENR